ncbi:MAG TPA: cupin domain-containing protein [Afifellaceae bacterium]|nr:cupin domain-containing protein [Afifellaceae bacterium]
MEGWHGAFASAIDKLDGNPQQNTSTLYVHGTLKVLLYAPVGEDHQIPHDRDELYVVARGSGLFKLGDSIFPFKPGDAIFVPAGVEHRFQEFTDDLASWVMFYGPVGGEAA